jgi:hypothetical protein
MATGSLFISNAIKSAAANVAIDVVGTEKYSAPSTSDVSYTNITVGASANGLVAVVVLANNSSVAITGGTAVWDSGGSNQSMSLIAEETRNVGALELDTLVFGLRAPVSGNKTLKIHWGTGTNECFMSAMSFTGVNQVSDAAAFPNNAITIAGNVAVTSNTGHYVSGGGQANTIGTITGTTIFSDSSSGSFINAAANYDVGATPNVTMGIASGACCYAVIDVSP